MIPLTPKQGQVIALLMRGVKAADAPEKVGVHRNAVFNRRRSCPEFQHALADAQIEQSTYCRAQIANLGDSAIARSTSGRSRNSRSSRQSNGSTHAACKSWRSHRRFGRATPSKTTEKPGFLHNHAQSCTSSSESRRLGAKLNPARPSGASVH
jgi:hypothetical protein